MGLVFAHGFGWQSGLERLGHAGMRSFTSSVIALGCLACAASARPLERPARAEPAVLVERARPAVADAGAGTALASDGAVTAIATDNASAEAVAPVVSFEPSYPADARPESDAALARWNAGGADSARAASAGGANNATSASAYQPVPRVVVELRAAGTRPLRPASVRLLEQIQAQTRDRGYWPFRRCFEAGLRDLPTLEGETRLALSISPHGRVLKARKLDSKLASPSVVTCLQGAAEQLKFTARPARRLEVVASIRLWPGDGPPPDAPRPAAVASDAPFDPLRTTALIAAESPALESCYRQARERDPQLWGRLALSVTLERDGTVHRIEETESRFPDTALTRCTQATLGKLVFGAVLGRPFVFVQPIRFGALPTE